jgi:hypothetical protein
VYAEDVKFLGDNAYIIKIQKLLEASKDVYLDVNVHKIKCMFMIHHQVAGQ